ncbi:hypothetical protein ACFSBZ_00260 [Amnibacterium flavum]|uniref:Integral membrane protein n=1 Tax=Amnibacterium flavum TaxID=2173173 RepID=A0A2V1HLY7_9MICO|nr:hypothetical protein [Amnibacterium flavum]PVZ93633.1 hypothetical protein DDQ50_15125 [Amnibacterium flavum]
MIEWFTIAQVVVAVAAGLLALVLGLIGRRPSDLTLAGPALVEILLIAQIVVAIAAPAAGNAPSGNPYEFWAYLLSAILIPAGAIAWALVDRTRWSTVVVGVACLSIAIMLYRMQIIWSVQGA